jgi:NADPH-dependent curcumin reductase CurA
VIERLNRRILLVERPVGLPEPWHFRRDDAPVGVLGDREFLVRNLYLSIDPAQRGWFGWQDYCIATDESVLRRVDPEQGSLSAALGVLGLTGAPAALAGLYRGANAGKKIIQLRGGGD